MKRNKVKKAEIEAAMLITGEEQHELDRVCAGLVDATEHARQAYEMIKPDTPDMKERPVPPLQSLRARDAHLGQLLEVMRTSLKAAWRGGDAELRAKLLAHWLHFAYTGALPLLQKKFQLALAIDKRDAATNFEKAFDAIPPRNKTDIPNGWRGIEREANRIAATITPDTFYFDIRKAFMLDAEATAEINGEESLGPVRAIIVGEQAEQLAATNANSEWLKSEEQRKKSKREKTGRKNQRDGEKNDNGRKTDEKRKNQIMTEVRQTMKKNKCSQSSACRIVCEKHLKADDKTPIFSRRTIENWMSRANRRKKP